MPDTTKVPKLSRISSAISSATDEMRANANPESKQASDKAHESAQKQSAQKRAAVGKKPGKKGAAARPSRPPRRARLRLTRIDPWSVMKTAFLLAVAMGVVTVVAVTIVWSVLGLAGVWDSLNQMVQDVIGGEETSNFDVENYLGFSRVMGFTLLVSVMNVVLLTAIATLGAFLYNMSAALLGGVELTLAEDQD